VADEEWARVAAAYGPHIPDKEQRARPRKNLELNSPGMELMRRLDIVDQLGRVDSPTLVLVGELDPVTPVGAAEEIFEACPRGSRGSKSSTEPATGRGRMLRTASGRR
jgi:pimeloyl-ACP methyl ester carboxylesterase